MARGNFLGWIAINKLGQVEKELLPNGPGWTSVHKWQFNTDYSMDIIGERLIPQGRGRQVKDIDDTTVPTGD